MTGLRSRVEDFLFNEASLLDAWRLTEWLALFAADAYYLVPPLGRPDADPEADTFLVNDNLFRLEQRIRSLLKHSAHAETPHSVTRHLVTNVQVAEVSPGRTNVRACFHVFRMRGAITTQYTGRYEHELRDEGDGFRFLRRTAILDQPELHPDGSVSILL